MASKDPRTAKSATVRIRSASVDSGGGRSKKHVRPSTSRNAMGEYIVPKGGRPLTAQVYTSPSGLDYKPTTKLTLPRAPEFTLKGQLNPLSKPPLPSPSDYQTGRDLVWSKDKNVTLKKKDVTWPYDTRKEAHITCSLGAGAYMLTEGNFGSGQKKPCSAKYKGRVQAGPPNALVQPCDTEGFQTPGPAYWPRPDTGRKSSIGSQYKKDQGETLGPGPATYTLPDEEMPTPLIGELLSGLSEPPKPGPNAYTVPACVGTGPKKTFGQKHMEKKIPQTPAPNHYKVGRPESAVSTSMTYRAFPAKTDKKPGPGDHTPELQAALLRNPEYSCRENCVPVFPDILQYTEHQTLYVPGPGSYEPDKEFSDNSHPAYSISLPLPQRSNSNPGPNHYTLSHEARSDLRKAPKYSMGRRLSDSDLPSKTQQELPGPGAYVPRTLDRPQSCKITPRRPPLKKSVTPGANRYSIEENQTRKGKGKSPSFSMKGRPSPFVYSGFSNVAMSRCSSLV